MQQDSSLYQTRAQMARKLSLWLVFFGVAKMAFAAYVFLQPPGIPTVLTLFHPVWPVVVLLGFGEFFMAWQFRGKARKLMAKTQEQEWSLPQS